MAAYMVQSRSSSEACGSFTMLELAFGHDRAVDLHLIQQCRFPNPRSYPVETFEHQGSAREPRAGDKEQKERQQHRYVDRQRSKGVMSQRTGLLGGKAGLFVVLLPRTLEPE